MTLYPASSESMSHRGVDVESTARPLLGYPSLSDFIASDRDRTTLIFKRFDELAARNILYLQSEIADLQAQQRAFDQEDLTSDRPTKQCARNFKSFKDAALQLQNNAKQQARWELMLRIRSSMIEYREALLSEVTLATLPRPSKDVLRAFQEDFYNQHQPGDEPFPTLGGHSAGLYDDKDDLVALRVQQDSDRLTSFVQRRLAFMFPVRIVPKPKSSKDVGLTLDHRTASAPEKASRTLRIALSARSSPGSVHFSQLFY